VPSEPDTPLVPGVTTKISLQVGDQLRTFHIRLPPQFMETTAAPLLYVLHGRFGSGLQTESTYGFAPFADNNGWIVVYPDGYEKSWADGRGATPADLAGIDDLAFFDAMQVYLEQRILLDPLRIYCCGMSNGAFMTQRLGLERTGRFAAIAWVAGTLAVSHLAQVPSANLSVLIIHGQADSLVPYTGGSAQGDILGVDALEERWHVSNNITVVGSEVVLPDLFENTCRVWCRASENGPFTVKRLRIVGGGHNWPSRPGALVLGAVCYDVDATREISQFFTEHPRPNPGGSSLVATYRAVFTVDFGRLLQAHRMPCRWGWEKVP